jgi:hypothetical protein
MLMVVLLSLSLPLPAWAASPFDGTWRMNPKSIAIDKPIEQTLANGRYKCSGCDPNFVIDVKADGTDQKVTGTRDFDTVNVKPIDARTMQAVYKKDGQIVVEVQGTVSRDGKTLDGRVTFHPMQGPPVKTTGQSRRVGPAPAGAHATSGAWQLVKLDDVSKAGTEMSYHATPDGLTMTAGTGETYAAKFDGPAVPLVHDRSGTTVSIKKLAPDAFEEIYKQGDKVIADNRVRVHGNTMDVVSTDAQQRKTTMAFERVAGK